MSGVKDTIVNLRQSEYDRLMRTCQQVGNLDQEIQRSMAAREREIRWELEQEVSERCRHLEGDLREMDATIAEMHRTHNKALEENARQAERRFHGLEQRIDGQRTELIGLLKEQEQRFEGSLSAQRRDFDAKIREINERVQAREMREQELAKIWLRDTESFLGFLAEQYRHEKFAPGDLDRLQGQLRVATQNAADRQYQAALATAQQTFFQGQELRSRLELREIKWSLHLQEARRRSLELIAACEAQAACKFAFDVESAEGVQERIEIAGEIDHWTRGGLTQLLNTARERESRLQPSAVESLDLEDLKQLSALAADNRAELERLTTRAREAIIASQLRHDIASRIEDALRNEGWEIIDSTYEGEDQREALHVKLAHLNGAQIVAQLCPEEMPGGNIGNRVSLGFYDDSISDERAIQSRLGKVMQSVSEQGVEVGRPRCAPGFERTLRGDEERRDFERVRRMQPARGTKSSQG